MRTTTTRSGERVGINISIRLGSKQKGRAKAGTESWYYGESVVYFSNNKVVAWSDRGELSMRSRLRGRQSKKNFTDDGWQSAWRREKPVSSKDVLNDLVGEEDGL